MLNQIFRTRITDILGMRHPILMGGMMYLSDAPLVAAAVNAGAMGFITCRSYPTVDAFRADLKKCKELTGGTEFGVNLTLSRRFGFDNSIETLLNVALEEGVRKFESAGIPPTDIVQPIHAAGGVLVHKVPRIRHALTAQRLGVDAVAIVGMEEGGHPGKNDLTSFVQAAHLLGRIEIPVVVGGGIGHGRQIAAALAMGADGVVMGSRFTAAVEATAHANYKRAIVAATEDCSTTALTSLNDTWRVLDNENVREVQRIEASGATRYEDYGDLIRGFRTKEYVYDKGEMDKGMISLSSAAGFVPGIESVERIIDTLVSDAAGALDAVQRKRLPVMAKAAAS